VTPGICLENRTLSLNSNGDKSKKRKEEKKSETDGENKSTTRGCES